MQAGRGGKAVAMAVVLVLGACGGPDQPNLMNIRQTTEGPDEFGILPPKALELPEDLAALPPPTPGGANRTDPNPTADAIAALGGNPAAVTRGGISSGDAALVGYTTRYGVSSEIRQTLAMEDLEFRRNNDGRLLERLFDVNVYYRAYEQQSLDQQAELQRWRGAGARTVSAPPPKDGESDVVPGEIN
jgi:hypothetical protein